MGHFFARLIDDASATAALIEDYFTFLVFGSPMGHYKGSKCSNLATGKGGQRKVSALAREVKHMLSAYAQNLATDVSVWRQYHDSIKAFTEIHR